MDRLTIDEYCCMLTICGKSRSEDPFTQCSAVGIRKDKTIIGVAYNGMKAGHSVPPWAFLEENRKKKNLFFAHAERNLLRFCSVGECFKTYINRSPCEVCALEIAMMGIEEVVFLEEYHREQNFKEIFDRYGVKYRELSREEKSNIRRYLIEEAASAPELK